MAEARARKTSHFKSEIFTEGPAPETRRLRSVNAKSYENSSLFTPLAKSPKPMTYSREKFFQCSDIFAGSKDPEPEIKEPSTPKPDILSMSAAGIKDKYVKPDNILGNDRPCFYRKTINKYIEQTEFTPRFDETSIRQKVEKEFFGGFHSMHLKKEPKVQVPEQNAKQRKINNLKSVFDKNVAKENIPPSAKKPAADYSSSKRKFEILASGVFDEKPVQDYPRVSRKEDFDEKRHKNHLYTDLAGTEREFGAKKKGELVSCSEHWLNHTTKTNNLAYDPNEHIFDSFRSSLTPEPYKTKTLRNRSTEALSLSSSLAPESRIKQSLSPKRLKQEELRTSLQPLQEFSNKVPEVQEFELHNIPKKYDKNDLKKLCEGIHVITSDLDFDAITGQCKGTGKVSFRCRNTKAMKNFEIKLLNEGITLKSGTRTDVPKSKYWQVSNVPLKEFRQGRTPNPDINARHAKINEQLSNVFGKPRKFTPVRIERDLAYQSQMQWKKTRNAKRDAY